MAEGGQPNSFLEAALAYAARGWAVFPCAPGSKQPLVAAEKVAGEKPIKGTGGVKKASRDAEQIRAWWAKWPKALIGVAMGRPDGYDYVRGDGVAAKALSSGLFAVDFDPREDDATGEVFELKGLKAATEAQIGVALPRTLTSQTQSGGVHLFFAWPPAGAPIINRGNLPEHVDVRGEGGYVIVPPSVMATGKAYRWLREGAAVDAPEKLLEVLRSSAKAEAERTAGKSQGGGKPARADVGSAVRKYALAALDAECQALSGARDGGRNEQIDRSAFALGQLVGAGVLAEGVVRAALGGIVAAWPNVGKSEGSIDSGLEAGKAQPRDLSEVEAAAERRGSYGGRPRGPAAAANGPAPTGAHPDASASSSASAPGPPVRSEEKSSRMGASAAGATETGGGGEEAAAADLERKCGYRPTTEVGNAERWRDRHADNFRFCPTVGWHAWDGRRWSRDDADTLLAISLVDTIRSIQDEADAIEEAGDAWDEHTGRWRPMCASEGWPDDPNPIVQWKGSGDNKYPVFRSDKHRAWGRSSESDRMVKAMRSLILRYITVKLVSFDADPMKLNVANGTLVFEPAAVPDNPNDFTVPTVRLQPHDRADLITMLADTVYEPAATANTPVERR